jgi:type I restriction enzyme, S subunit
MTLFKDIAIKDFAEVTSSKRIFLNDYVENGIPFWRSKEVIEQFKGAEISNELFITEKKYYNIKNKFGVPVCGDILITSVGTIGVPFLVKDDSPFYFKDGNLTWIKNIADSVDPKYLYLWISSQIGQQTIDNQLIGSSQKALTIAALKKIKIPIPLLPTQQKIAKILSNYDDLIENNLKRIKLLEESARLTFEEWFLRYRIKGKKLNIDQTSGLPFNWKKIKIKNYVATISKGPSLNYNLGTSKGVEVLNQSCIRNGEIELEKVLIARELSDNKKSAYLKVNDILINSMGQGTLGRVSKNVSVDKKMIIHNCITFLRAKDKYSQFMLFYFISLHQQYFEIVAHGSTGQSTLKKDLISSLMITLPDDKTLKSFDLIVASIWNEIGILKKQNQLLKEARDILLPRLMTGIIDTDDMDIAV